MKDYIKTSSAIKVLVNSHNFVVSNLTFSTQTAVRDYASKFINVEKRWVKKRLVVTEKEKYFHEIKPVAYQPSIFRFHRHCLSDFLKAMAFRGHTQENLRIVVTEAVITEPVAVKYNWISDKADRDNQPEVIKFCTDGASRTKTISMQTGKGKTYCAFRIINIMQVRSMIMVLPKYTKRWVDDIAGTFGLASGEFLIIDSTEKLISFLDNEVNARVQMIIVTTTTWASYIKDYMEYGSSNYPVPPHLFNDHAKIGIRVIDEVHEYFHANFIADLYINIQFTLNLSATIDPKNNEYRNSMQRVMMPTKYRICPEYDRYIDVLAYKYRISGADKKIRTRGFGGMYSHVKFEQSILQRKSLALAYFNFIYSIIEDTYLSRKLQGHRLLMLFHQTDMCDAFYRYLSGRIKDLKICFYHGKSEVRYGDLPEYDIIVSTKSSCGTAVDLPMLLVTLMVACEESNTGNEQALGRTRKLADGTVPYFVYTFCTDVPSQVTYHESKTRYFGALVNSQRVIDNNVLLD